MRNARELLLGYTSNIRHPDAAAALFAEDGAVELPYLASLGIPHRAQGREKIRAFLVDLLQAVPDYGFDSVDILIDTPDQVFGEYTVERTTRDGRPFSQLYGGRLVAVNGEIKLLREYLDLIRAARAMLPNGIADIPAPEQRT
ncbi:nuclear transport factor 2 family protein [Streptomyces sp. NPDC005345]|uniref:nuclear transport factor 2 family protein n=1 Tax=Streptomyces sp. NPDC005345 TaxID=3156877 RepID=UPI0033BA8782